LKYILFHPSQKEKDLSIHCQLRRWSPSLTNSFFKQAVTVEEGLEMASRNNASHLQASAKTGNSIEAAFQMLVADILLNQELNIIADEKFSSARRRRSSAVGFH
jgi:hypothetical protein